jgi:hypothetical protein
MLWGLLLILSSAANPSSTTTNSSRGAAGTSWKGRRVKVAKRMTDTELHRVKYMPMVKKAANRRSIIKNETHGAAHGAVE